MKKTALKFILAFAMLFSTASLFGDIVQTRLDLTKRVMNTQDVLANAINLYIENYGTTPTTFADLTTANVLPVSFPTNHSFTFDVANSVMTLQHTLDFTWEQYQIDYYNNGIERKADFISSSVSPTFATSVYQIAPSALKSINYANAGIVVSPTPPTSGVADGEAWYDSLKKIVFIKNGTEWNNSNGTNLWIIRTIGELPPTATKGDLAIIITTTTVEKRIFNGSSWVVSNSIAYSYNGSF